MIRSFACKETQKLFQGKRVPCFQSFTQQAEKKRNLMNTMRPIHPGEVLKDKLIEIGMTANAFAHELHVPANRITAILNGKRSITADSALRLSHFFGTTPEFWLNLQTAYDLKIAKASVGNKIEKEIKLFKMPGPVQAKLTTKSI
jgi:addiction module HigA family antidote